MSYKDVVFQTNGEGFETLRKEVVNRQKAYEATMSKISEGLKNNEPVTVDFSKMDMQGFIKDLRAEAKNGFMTAHGTALKGASKLVLDQLQKDLLVKQSGIAMARMSSKPNKVEIIKSMMAEMEQLEMLEAEIKEIIGYTTDLGNQYKHPYKQWEVK